MTTYDDVLAGMHDRRPQPSETRIAAARAAHPELPIEFDDRRNAWQADPVIPGHWRLVSGDRPKEF